MAAGSSGKKNTRPWRSVRASGGLVAACLLVATAGGLILGAVFHRRLAAQQLLAYQTSLAAQDPAWMAAHRTIYADKKLPARTTFGEFLTDQGLDAITVSELIRDAHPVYDLARVRAGNEVKIGRSGSGALRAVGYQIDSDHVLWIKRDRDAFRANIVDVPYVVAAVGVAWQVQDSLIQAVEDAGEHDQLALEIADIFGWDLDFNTDTQRGDTFAAVVEKKMLYGKFQEYGRVLGAEYRNGGHTYQAVLFHDPEGRPAYYAPSGKSMKKAFLRSPLRFAARITSRFSYHRFHPILKRYRPHLGIDYGAPVGSAVQAVADGRVEFAGWRGESGKEVRLRHAMGYETYYLHLSRILVHVGQRVQQGQVIARTGATGLATGPHLDFRITQHGRFRNFLAMKLPPAESVARRDMDDFVETRSKLLHELAGLQTFPSNGYQRAAIQNPEPGPGKGK
jgi:murein DD-endopeptidase MepM/ murein hydrolase activator NlpD